MIVQKIVSGGQTGADRAALDFAISKRLPYGGWCPRDGWAEDYPEDPGLLEHYPELRSTGYSDVTVRTKWNVRDSDATIIFVGDSSVESPGTSLTVETAKSLNRPYLVTQPGDPQAIAKFLREQRDDIILNIAGPRESEFPGLYKKVSETLREVWQLLV